MARAKPQAACGEVRSEAEKNDRVVEKAINAMSGIEQSSQEIGNIIGA